MWLQQVAGTEVPSENGELNSVWGGNAGCVALKRRQCCSSAGCPVPFSPCGLWPFLHHGSFWRTHEMDKLALDFGRHTGAVKAQGAEALGVDGTELCGTAAQ